MRGRAGCDDFRWNCPKREASKYADQAAGPFGREPRTVRSRNPFAAKNAKHNEDRQKDLRDLKRWWMRWRHTHSVQAPLEGYGNTKTFR